MFPNYKMPWRVFFCLLIVVAAPTSATTDDISSLRNFICVLIRFWSWQGNLSNKERRKIKENTKKQNVSRLAENVTRFEKTKTCFRHYEKRVTMATQERDLSLLKDTSKRLLCSITTERDFYAQGQLQETSSTQSQLKETSKQLQRIEYSLNTWYTIRGTHNTARTEQTLFF